MKKLLAAIFLLCGLSACSQGIFLPQQPTSYGRAENREKILFALHPPSKDTIKMSSDNGAQFFYRPQDSSFWGWSSTKGFWKVGSNSSSTGQSPLRYTSYTNASTVGSTETTLIQDTIKAEWFSKSGDLIEFTASGGFATNSNSKRVNFYIDGVSMFLALPINTDASGNIQWHMRVQLFRVSSTVVRGVIIYSVTGQQTVTRTSEVSTSINVNSNFLIKVTGTGVTNFDIGLHNSALFAWANTGGGGSGSGSSTSSNLQQITNNGSVTTNDITIGNQLNITNNGFTSVLSAGAIGLSTNREIDIPDANGTIVLKVNGKTADSNGEVKVDLNDVLTENPVAYNKTLTVGTTRQFASVFTSPFDHMKTAGGIGVDGLAKTLTTLDTSLNTLFVLDGSGNTPGLTYQLPTSSGRLALMSDVGNATTVKQTYTSGTSYTVNNNTNWVIINPASTVATLSVALPLAADGQELSVSFGGTVTTGIVVTSLSFTGGTILGGNTFDDLEVIDNLTFKYNSSNLKWYRK